MKMHSLRKKILFFTIIICLIAIGLPIVLFWYTNGMIFFRGKMTSVDYIMSYPISIDPNKEVLTFSVLGKKMFGQRARDIFTINLSNGDIRQITKDGVSEFPTWLDKNRIIFNSSAEGLDRLNTIDTNSYKKTVLETLIHADDTFYSYYRPKAALNGKKIIFVRGELNKINNSYVEKLCSYDMDTRIVTEVETSSVKIPPDNSDLETRVKNIIKEGHRFAWQISPVGNELLILKDEILFQYSLEDQSKRILLKEKDIVDFDYRPPHIVILKRVNDQGDKLLVKDLASNKEISISDTAKIYYNPKWSPDGKFIAYSDSDSKETWLYDIGGEKHLKVTEGFFQTWISDEELIILREKIKLFIVSRDGQNLRQIFPNQTTVQ